MLLRFVAIFILTVSLESTCFGAGDQIAPAGAAALNLEIAGKLSLYHRLAVDSTATLAVKGPGKLDVLVRLSLKSELDTGIAYVVRVSENNTLLKTIEATSSPSESKWQNTNDLAAKSRKFTLAVPEGDHRLSFKLTNTKASAAGLRYLYESGKTSHKSDSDVYPLSMAGSVTVSLREKLIDFFLADKTRPVVVEVIGPTSLRVISRLAYSGTMKGPQKYNLSISLDNQSLRQEALTSEKSVNVDFTNHKEWSVGESRTTYLDVPGGKHRVSFVLNSTDAPAVALRFTIPKEDVSHSTE